MNTRLNGSPDLSTLQDADGKRWSEFRATLTRKPHVVLVNLLLCWLMIAGGFMFLVVTGVGAWLLISIPLVSIWNAFWLSSYMTHFHEAAHFNLARNKKTNDLLANLLFMPLIGLEIKSYRKSHWRHHLYLGTREDTEISYFEPLSFRNLLEGLTGVFLLRSGFRYLSTYRAANFSAHESSSLDVRRFMLGVTCFFFAQALIGFFLLWQLGAAACIAWLLTVFVFVPFQGRIRQTLEHRSLSANGKSAYWAQKLVPTNRLFGVGFFSSHFGGAGFNRHLLHHWDPLISYTCFDEMEAFLMNTSACAELEKARTSYFAAFIAMVRRA